MRDSCIFYRSFYESIKELQSDDKAILYDAIFGYSLDFIEPNLTGLSKAIFTLIKPQLDANIKRYKVGVENGSKGAEFGSKGGRPKEETPKEPSKEPINNPQDNPQQTDKEPANVNDNVNDNVNEEDNYVLFVSEFNKVRNSKFGTKSKAIKSSLSARIKEGYTIEKIISATKTAMREKYHIDNKFRHITPEFMTRINKLEKYSQEDNGDNGKPIEYYKGKEVHESNGRRFIHIGEGVEYIYPKEADTSGWTQEEKYNYYTCDRFNNSLSTSAIRFL